MMGAAQQEKFLIEQESLKLREVLKTMATRITALEAKE